jgi:hypothetical protein
MIIIGQKQCKIKVKSTPFLPALKGGVSWSFSDEFRIYARTKVALGLPGFMGGIYRCIGIFIRIFQEKRLALMAPFF